MSKETPSHGANLDCRDNMQVVHHRWFWRLWSRSLPVRGLPSLARPVTAPRRSRVPVEGRALADWRVQGEDFEDTTPLVSRMQ